MIDSVAIIEEHKMKDGLLKDGMCSISFVTEREYSLCSCVVCNICYNEDCNSSDHTDGRSASEGVHRVFSSEYLIPTYTNEFDYNDIFIFTNKKPTIRRLQMGQFLCPLSCHSNMVK